MTLIDVDGHEVRLTPVRETHTTTACALVIILLGVFAAVGLLVLS